MVMRVILSCFFLLLVGLPVCASETDTSRITSYFSTIRSIGFTDVDSAYNIALVALEESKDYGTKHQQLEAMLVVASLQQNRGEVFEAIDLLESVLNAPNVMPLFKYRALLYLGNIQMTQLKNYVSAVRYFLEAEAMHDQLNETGWISVTYNNLGACYVQLGYNEGAKACFEKVLDDSPPDRIKGGALYNLAEIAENQDSTEIAISYALKALDFWNSGSQVDAYNRMYVFSMLTKLHLGKDMKLCQVYLDSAMATAEGMNNPEMTNGAILLRGKAHLAKGNCTEALKDLQTCYSFFKETILIDDLLDCRNELIKVHRCLGNSAEEMLMYEEIRLAQEDQEKGMQERELEAVKQLLRFQEELKNAETNAHDFKEKADSAWSWIITIAVFGIVLLVLLAYILLLIRNAQGSNAQLAELNEQLEVKVEDRTRVIQTKSQRLRDYTSWNAHKLRAPVANMKGLLELLQDGANGKDSQDLLESLNISVEKLDQTVQEFNREMSEE